MADFVEARQKRKRRSQKDGEVPRRKRVKSEEEPSVPDNVPIVRQASPPPPPMGTGSSMRNVDVLDMEKVETSHMDEPMLTVFWDVFANNITKQPSFASVVRMFLPICVKNRFNMYDMVSGQFVDVEQFLLGLYISGAFARGTPIKTAPSTKYVSAFCKGMNPDMEVKVREKLSTIGNEECTLLVSLEDLCWTDVDIDEDMLAPMGTHPEADIGFKVARIGDLLKELDWWTVKEQKRVGRHKKDEEPVV